MGDEEGESPKYVYEGERAPGVVHFISAGEMTQNVELMGEREGVGKATFPNGDTFEGCYSAGVRSGEGTYSYAAPPPGEEEEAKPPLGKYEGAWKDGAKSLVGTLEYSSGHKYQGTWKDGKREGEGTMFYPNGDIYTGMWVAGQKHGNGVYIYKESGAKLHGIWKKNQLTDGSFIDKFGNTYTGQFASTETAARFNAGGAFSLASGASAVMPSGAGMVWTKSYGVLCVMQCKSEEAAASAIAVSKASLSAQLGAEKGAMRATMLGKVCPVPSNPKYPALMPLDQSKAMWLEQFKDRSAFETHKASPRLQEVVPELLRYGAEGTAADFSSTLECEMLHLEKPRAAAGPCYVRIIAMTAKEVESVPKLLEWIKGEVYSNMVNEPNFLRGTLLCPTADAPKTLRWVMHWTSRAELDAHTMYPHHKNIDFGGLFGMVDMTAIGGALEFADAISFKK